MTGVTNASRTMLMNLKILEWDQEIVGIFDIPYRMLPEIRPSSDSKIYDYTLQNGPLGASVPVCGDLDDQQVAIVGQICYNSLVKARIPMAPAALCYSTSRPSRYPVRAVY